MQTGLGLIEIQTPKTKTPTIKVSKGAKIRNR